MRKENRKNLSDKIAYTLVLRIRTLHIIKKLMSNKKYSKKEFINIIRDISKGANAYEGYLTVKDNLEEKNKISIGETERLYEYLKNELDRIKKFRY